MTGCPASYTEVFAILGWIITGLGWYITSAQANTRDKRKELRAQIDSLIETIDITQEFAFEYYSNQGDARQKNRLQLFQKLQKIETKNSVITKYENNFDVNSEFSGFWEAITDGDFDSKLLKKLDSSDERFSRISSACSYLISKIEVWYLNAK